MRRVILEAGGAFRRITTVVTQALNMRDAFIIVSTEERPTHIKEFFEFVGIPTSRYILDYRAWDTVTNFTLTKPLVVGRADELYIVTDAFHMLRCWLIAKIVYFGSGIKIIKCPYRDPTVTQRDPVFRVVVDVARSLVFRLTGITLYNPWVKKRRMGIINAMETEANG